MFPFKMMIFHSYVSLLEGNCFQFIKSRNNVRIDDPGLARGPANWFMLATQKSPPKKNGSNLLTLMSARGIRI